MKVKNSYLFILYILLIQSCSLVGDKNNKDVDDVFKQGNIDPNLVTNNLGYVPIYPFFGHIVAPTDVFVGYDEMIYVVCENNANDISDNTLEIFDQKGEKVYSLVIPGATDVTQDRRLMVYVAGRVQKSSAYSLAAVYCIKGLSENNIQFEDTIVHYQCDESRLQTSFRGTDDVAVQFTGIATLYDNTLYVSRTGPRNDLGSFVRPDNGVLIFDKNHVNIGFSDGLEPSASGLKSCAGMSSIASNCAPPQKLQSVSNSRNFFITLNDIKSNLEYRALSILVQDIPDVGVVYTENPSLLNFDNSKADRFLYEPFRFSKPEDCFIAPDQLNYYFVADSGTDSIYVFTNKGFEGVNPPANSTLKKQVLVSFGGPGKDGSGSGPFNFKDPSGICYYNRMILVADKGNNRICRYKLNTDLQ